MLPCINTPAYHLMLVQQQLCELGTVVFSHLLSSPNLEACDFYLFHGGRTTVSKTLNSILYRMLHNSQKCIKECWQMCIRKAVFLKQTAYKGFHILTLFTVV